MRRALWDAPGLCREDNELRNNVAHGVASPKQWARICYDVVSYGEIFDQKRIDCADFAYGVATVIGSFFIGIHGDQVPLRSSPLSTQSGSFPLSNSMSHACGPAR
jgi:hypothetical protein